MSKVCDFIRDCGVFFVLTMNDKFPAGRPFGAIMEDENGLYISTADTKALYKQIKENGNIQLLALKHGTREWIRVTGIAKENNSNKIKKKMLTECPVLKKHYESEKSPHYNIFQIDIIDVEFN